MYFYFKSVKKRMSTAVTMTDNTTPKECATTVTIKLEEPKNPGNASIKNYMLTVCVKTVTLTSTTK